MPKIEHFGHFLLPLSRLFYKNHPNMMVSQILQTVLSPTPWPLPLARRSASARRPVKGGGMTFCEAIKCGLDSHNMQKKPEPSLCEFLRCIIQKMNKNG
jgi:hypothetical protein